MGQERQEEAEVIPGHAIRGPETSPGIEGLQGNHDFRSLVPTMPKGREFKVEGGAIPPNQEKAREFHIQVLGGSRQQSI